MNNIKKHYDYLIVGCGLFGAVFAEQAISKGKTVLIIDKRNHIGGNVYTEDISGICIHKYGPHVFHTSDKEVWEYVNKFTKFNDFIINTKANYKGEIYNLPFNMNTFEQLWGVKTPEEAKNKIQSQILNSKIKEINNLEDQAISFVGTDIYNKLIKGYTEKQWGRECKDLPAFIIKRLPVRFEYNNNYFNDIYQGIPDKGYTDLIFNLIKGADILLNTDYSNFKNDNNYTFDKIVYTGRIDEYYDYKLGKLEYRTVYFENELLDIKSFQGSPVVNYTDRETPYTRIIEHKYFNDKDQEKTYISKEYPVEFKEGFEPYYPINNERNNKLYNEYKSLAEKEKNIFFKGRLGEYTYYDMDDIVRSALDFAKKLYN